jgi:hypothetical protein
MREKSITHTTLFYPLRENFSFIVEGVEHHDFTYFHLEQKKSI